MKERLLIIITATIIFGMCPPAFSGDCEKVVDLYNTATNSKQLEQKEKLFKEALGLDCKKAGIVARVHNNLADSYEMQGKFDMAVAEYKKALEIYPGLATACFSLGDIYFNQAKYEYAIDNYEKGLVLEDDEIAERNLKKAREKRPLYKSKNQIVSSLSLTRAIGVSRSTNLYFGFNETVLSTESERQLETLFKALSAGELRSYRFRTAGHTCSKGTEEFNRELSEKRSKSVNNWLVDHGFPSHCLTSVGFGEAKPIADNTSEEGRRLNRRVEIKTTGIDFSTQRAVIAGEGLKLFNEGQELYDRGDSKKAVELFEKALNLFKKNEDGEGMRAATGTLAVVYSELGDKKNASRYSKLYQEISK